MKCPNCGFENSESARFCKTCGTNLRPSTPYQPSQPQITTIPPAVYPPQPIQPSLPQANQDAVPKKKRITRKVIVIAVVVVILMVAIVGIVWVVPTQSASVIVTVHSTHILNSINYGIYLNGVGVASGSLAAGSSDTHVLTAQFTIAQSGNYNIVVSATTTGGGLGATSDQQTVTLSSGGSYPITLNV